MYLLKEELSFFKIMKIFFTADTHFNHVNIIKYCNRPYKTVEDMNKSLIDNWNDVVGPNDIVYHLGDFCLGRIDEFDSYFNKLNGKIILIEGNHDRNASRHKDRFYEYHVGYIEVNVDGWPIVLSHYAMKVWNNSHNGSFHLYGHSHGTLPDDPLYCSMDVGVDCHNYKPIDINQIEQFMSKKSFKSIS